ncbi:MAG: PulJ/GspJ family protein [Gemmatimonadales bacterium]
MSPGGDTLKRDPGTALRERVVVHRAHASACGPHGFTLIEILVALTIASLVVAAAHRIFSGVADGAKSIGVAREELDRSANARRWLKATFLSLEPPFEGRADRVSFTAWQLGAGGWLEPHPIELRREGDRLTAHRTAAPLVLFEGVGDLAFDYLLDPGANSKWVREWISPVSAPLAVRLRLGRGTGEGRRVDTLLFLVKERG